MIASCCELRSVNSTSAPLDSCYVIGTLNTTRLEHAASVVEHNHNHHKTLPPRVLKETVVGERLYGLRIEIRTVLAKRGDAHQHRNIVKPRTS